MYIKFYHQNWFLSLFFFCVRVRVCMMLVLYFYLSSVYSNSFSLLLYSVRIRLCVCSYFLFFAHLVKYFLSKHQRHEISSFRQERIGNRQKNVLWTRTNIHSWLDLFLLISRVKVKYSVQIEECCCHCFVLFREK